MAHRVASISHAKEEPTIVRLNDIVDEYPESHHHTEMRPDQLYYEQQNTNYTDQEIKYEVEQPNAVYIDCNDEKENGGDEFDDIWRNYCCVVITILSGVIITIISFLWFIDDSPYSDCAVFIDSAGCVDDEHDNFKDEDHDNLNDVALGFLIFGLLLTITGSFICYKKLKKEDEIRDAQREREM